MSITDPLLLRKAMGNYASGLTIIASIQDGAPVGFTCQSFHSLSLEPALVNFSVMKSSSSWPRIRQCPGFSINVLSMDQLAVSQSFGRSGVDRWKNVGWKRSAAGNPLLDNGMLSLDCELEAEHEAGDHFLIVARVLTLHEDSADRDPLLFYRGAYHGVESLRELS